MSERDAAADLGEMSKLFQEPGGAMSLALFAMDAMPYWIREAERLRGENDRLGAKVVGLEMRIHGMESALAIWRDDDDE